jgi:hypothetical protein
MAMSNQDLVLIVNPALDLSRNKENPKRKELSSIYFLIPTRTTVDNSPMNKPVIAEHLTTFRRVEGGLESEQPPLSTM